MDFANRMSQLVDQPTVRLSELWPTLAGVAGQAIFVAAILWPGDVFRSLSVLVALVPYSAVLAWIGFVLKSWTIVSALLTVTAYSLGAVQFVLYGVIWSIAKHREQIRPMLSRLLIVHVIAAAVAVALFWNFD